MPTPLSTDGAARDTVLWTNDPQHGTVATVIRLPIVQPTEWAESGVLVAVPDHDAPPDLWPVRRAEIARAREVCSILLRTAPREMTVDDADDWITAQLDDRHTFRLAAAVVWPERCVLRRWSGQRLDATGDSIHQVPWTHVPSALLSALAQRTPARPPTSLTVRAFGTVHGPATISVSSTWGAPSRHYTPRIHPQPLTTRTERPALPTREAESRRH